MISKSTAASATKLCIDFTFIQKQWTIKDGVKNLVFAFTCFSVRSFDRFDNRHWPMPNVVHNFTCPQIQGVSLLGWPCKLIITEMLFIVGRWNCGTTYRIGKRMPPGAVLAHSPEGWHNVWRRANSMRKSVLPELPLVSSVTFTYSGTAAPMCSWSWLGARHYVIRLENAPTRRLVAFAFVFIQVRCSVVSSSYNK